MECLWVYRSLVRRGMDEVQTLLVCNPLVSTYTSNTHNETYKSHLCLFQKSSLFALRLAVVLSLPGLADELLFVQVLLL